MKLICLLFLFSPSLVFADLECGPLDPRQQVGEKAVISINGSAKALFKAIGGDADYKNITEKEIKNLYQNYPNADKLVLNGKLIYTFCTYLKSAKDLDSHEKFSKLTEFMKLLISDPVAVIQTDKNNNKVAYYEKNDIVTEVKNCTLRAKRLKCFLNIISLENDLSLQIYAYYNDTSHSRIILPSGKSVLANKVTFSAHTNERYVTGEMIASIPMEATIFFEEVNDFEGGKLPLLEVQYKDFSARLKDVVVNKEEI